MFTAWRLSRVPDCDGSRGTRASRSGDKTVLILRKVLRDLATIFPRKICRRKDRCQSFLVEGECGFLIAFAPHFAKAQGWRNDGEYIFSTSCWKRIGYCTVIERSTVRVAPPLVAVAFTMYVPAGVPLGGVAPPPPPPQDVSNRRLRARIGRSTRVFLLRTCVNSRTASARSQTTIIGTLGDFGWCESGCDTGTNKLRAVVVTFTVNETGAVPETCAETGETLQAPAGGGLLHPRVTLPVNPLRAFNSSAIAAVCPAVTVVDVVPPGTGAIWKSVAVPVSHTVGFVAELSVRVRVALRVPAARGKKSTSIVQFPPTGTVTLAPFAAMQLPET